MQTATIQIKYVNQPKPPSPGKKQGPGSVKDTNDVLWKVWKDQLGSFVEGQTYTVGYETEQYQGKEQYTVKEVLPATASPATAPVRQTPSPVGRGEPSKDKHIFVCGVVNNAIRAGKLDPTSEMDMLNVAKTAGAVYDAWHQ